MLRSLLLAVWVLPLWAQSTLYVCASMTKDYVVGAKLRPSGLFRRTTAGAWEHAGFNHPFVFGIGYDSLDPSTLYLAAGNGLIRAANRGEKWTILTGSDITELRDLWLDGGTPGTIYIAHTAGIRLSRDAGRTWREIGGGLHRKYTEAIRGDARNGGVVLAGTEEGIFRSDNAGASWRLAGAAGFQIMRLEQSPHDPCEWMAATQQGGLFGSRDCGSTFENVGRLGVGNNLYAVAFDPSDPDRVAVAGWGPGVVVSSDRGKNWLPRNSGLASTEVTAVVFDPGKPRRLFAAVHEQAIYRSEDAGVTWVKDGLEGSHVTCLRFIPEGRQ